MEVVDLREKNRRLELEEKETTNQDSSLSFSFETSSNTEEENSIVPIYYNQEQQENCKK